MIVCPAERGGAPAKVRQILERMMKQWTKPGWKIRSYIKEHSEFEEIGERMLKEWDEGGSVSAAYLIRLSDVVIPADAHVCALRGIAMSRFLEITIASHD